MGDGTRPPEPQGAPSSHAAEPRNATASPEAASPEGAPPQDAPRGGDADNGRATRRPGRLRRLARSRGGVAVVGVLVGALLGTGLMAWRSDELPFVDRDKCWGSLSPDVVNALFTDTDIRSSELPLRRMTSDLNHAECSMQGFGDDELESEVTASVRTLGELRGTHAWNWTKQYLSSRMTPLGGKATGMASSTRAWVALPASCKERYYEPGETPPLRVVSLATRAAYPDWDNEVDARRSLDAMSRAVVRLANGVMDQYGCEGGYADPPKLPRAPEGKEVAKADADRLCGLPGVRLPQWARDEDASAERTTPGAGPKTSTSGKVRTCDVGRPFGLDRLRLTTVADPELARVVSRSLGDRAERLGGDGEGRHAGGLSVYTAKCPKDPVAFVAYEKGQAKQWDGQGPGKANDRPPLDLAVLPSYAKAEAKRLGCGEVEVKAPRVPEQ